MMLISKIEEIRKHMVSVSIGLKELNPENFSFKFCQLTEEMSRVKELKAELLKMYKKADFEPFNEDFLALAKEIEENYDNIIRLYQQKLEDTEKKMLEIVNLKKLYNYAR